MNPLASLIQTGTKLWLDSVDPDLVRSAAGDGATGATSNPVIVSDLIKTGRFDKELEQLLAGGATDEQIAWNLTDQLVSHAQQVFAPIWRSTAGDDGYVSFELDPLLEDPQADLPHEQRVRRYVEDGRRWAEGQDNRLIKVPATAAGLDALEDLTAAGVTLNVTLIFTTRQYQAARDAIWRGAQRRDDLSKFKSVYSIFISRVDVYTAQHVQNLSAAAQGMTGLLNAKRMWSDNQRFWSDKGSPLHQEIVFASTGVKDPNQDPWKYVAALAGSDIQTNPPATNDAVADSGLTFEKQVDSFPPDEVVAEIDEKVDVPKMESVLMKEGIEKFAGPQKALLELISQKRVSLVG